MMRLATHDVKGNILGGKRYAFTRQEATDETAKSRRNHRKSYKMLV